MSFFTQTKFGKINKGCLHKILMIEKSSVESSYGKYGVKFLFALFTVSLFSLVLLFSIPSVSAKTYSCSPNWGIDNSCPAPWYYCSGPDSGCIVGSGCTDNPGGALEYCGDASATVTKTNCLKMESGTCCCDITCSNIGYIGPSQCGPPAPVCTPSSACAANTCVGQTCSNGCGGKVAGTKVCQLPSEAYWANMNGKEITHADFGDTVELVMTNRNSGSFSIKENDTNTIDKIRNVSGISHNKNNIGMWTISQEDLDKTSDFGQFYFTTNEDANSDYLTVSPTGDDDPMNITLLSPACGSYFDNGEKFIINVSANDDDDLIDGTVSVNGNAIGTFHNGGIVLNDTLPFGNSQIIVEANNTRGERRRISSNIMVLDKENGEYIDGEYIAACIKSPKDLSNIGGNVVDFDASTTRAIKIVNGVIHVLSPDNGDTFSWYWKFMPDNIVRNFVDSTNPLAYRFTAEFPTPGDNSALLMVTIN